MLSRRQVLKLGGAAAVSAALPQSVRILRDPDYSLDIAPYSLQISAKHSIKTIAYNQQVPGQLLRFKEGQPVTIDVTNHTGADEIVHWHGLFLPSEVDGAMEEGTPMIAPAERARSVFTPRPAGFRWYHTHTFAGAGSEEGPVHRPTWLSAGRAARKSGSLRSGVLSRPARLGRPADGQRRRIDESRPTTSRQSMERCLATASRCG